MNYVRNIVLGFLIAVVPQAQAMKQLPELQSHHALAIIVAAPFVAFAYDKLVKRGQTPQDKGFVTQAQLDERLRALPSIEDALQNKSIVTQAQLDERLRALLSIDDFKSEIAENNDMIPASKRYVIERTQKLATIISGDADVIKQQNKQYVESLQNVLTLLIDGNTDEARSALQASLAVVEGFSLDPQTTHDEFSNLIDEHVKTLGAKSHKPRDHTKRKSGSLEAPAHTDSPHGHHHQKSEKSDTN